MSIRSIPLSVMLLTLLSATVKGDDWPQWMGPRRDGIWRESGIVRQLPPGELKFRWRMPIAGGYSGPAVAQGRVVVMDYVKQTGEAKNNPGERPALQGTERILCFDAQSGQQRWKHEYPCAYGISYPAGPRATPTVSEDLVFTVGAEGDLHCLELATGKVVWSKNFKRDYQSETPLWGYCSHPLVEGNTLFVIAGGEGSVAIAFDKRTGKELWKNLSATEPGYSSPGLIDAGGKRQLIVFHSEGLNGLDPQTGDVFWKYPLRPNYGMSIMTPVKHGDLLFAGAIQDVGVMLKLDSTRPAVKLAWQGEKTKALYPVCPSPVVEEDGTMYGVDRYGHLRCVDFATGKRLWETTKPTTGGRPANSATAFLVKNQDRYFVLSETGDLIVAELTRKEYREVSRARLLEPTGEAFGRSVLWSHPAYAEKAVFARNDKELVSVSLAE